MKNLFDLDLGSDMSHDLFGESKSAHKKKHKKGSGSDYGVTDLARDTVVIGGSIATLGILGATTVAITNDLLD